MPLPARRGALLLVLLAVAIVLPPYFGTYYTRFATQIAIYGMNFVILKDRTHLLGAKAQIDHLKQMARSHGRETRIWIHVYVVCRETEKEARDYLHHYVHEQGDWEAAGNLLKIFGLHNQTLDAKTLDGHKAHFIAGHVFALLK